MTCDGARESIMLAAYDELPDSEAIGLEEHLARCERCLRELEAVRHLHAALLELPMREPDPNLVAQSRMRLDEALDALPRHGFLTQLQANAVSWLRNLQSAPALATLLIGTGFLAGNYTHRYQVAHEPGPKTGHVTVTSPNGGGVATITAISELPDKRLEVKYDRTVPEMAQGSLDDPQIRQLLVMGTQAASNNRVRVDSVSLLAGECQIGHVCRGDSEELAVRDVLLKSLRSDRNPGVRLKALEGLRGYVSEDERVRDGVAQALLHDGSAALRERAISILQPVESDSSVRQALRAVSATDTNPYLRTVSMQVLQGVDSLQ